MPRAIRVRMRAPVIDRHGKARLIVDDPVKSREETESQLKRDRVWDWWQNDLYTRLFHVGDGGEPATVADNSLRRVNSHPTDEAP